MSTENRITPIDEQDYDDYQEVQRPQEQEIAQDKPTTPETVSYAEYEKLQKSNSELRTKFDRDLAALKNSTNGIDQRFSGLENTLGELKTFLESAPLGQTQETQAEGTATQEQIDEYSSEDDFVTKRELMDRLSRVQELEQELKIQKEAALDPSQLREDLKKELTAEWEQEQAASKLISDQNTLIKAGEDPQNVEMAGYWLMAETNRIDKAIEQNPYDEELKQRRANLSSSFLESYQIFKNEKQGLFTDANATQKANEVIANQANSAYRNNVMPEMPGQAGGADYDGLPSLTRAWGNAHVEGESARTKLSQF